MSHLRPDFLVILYVFVDEVLIWFQLKSLCESLGHGSCLALSMSSFCPPHDGRCLMTLQTLNLLQWCNADRLTSTMMCRALPAFSSQVSFYTPVMRLKGHKQGLDMSCAWCHSGSCSAVSQLPCPGCRAPQHRAAAMLLQHFPIRTRSDQ